MQFFTILLDSSLVFITLGFVFIVILIIFILRREKTNVTVVKVPKGLIQSHSMINLNKRRNSFTHKISNDLSEFQSDFKLGDVAVNEMVSKYVKTRLRSEMKLPKFLSLGKVKEGVETAVKKYKQREMYKMVMKSSKGGDGLLSIFDRQKNFRKTFDETTSHTRNSAKFKHNSSMVDFLNTSPFEIQNNDAVFKVLNFHPTFSWIPLEVLTCISNEVKLKTLKAGEILYSIKEDVDYIFVVVAGEISVHTESCSVLNEEVNKLEQDYVLYPGRGGTNYSEILAIINKGSFNSVINLTARSQVTKILTINAQSLENVAIKFTGFREQLILELLIRFSKETMFPMHTLSGESVLKNPDICSLELDKNIKSAALVESHVLFENLDATGRGEPVNNPNLTKVFANEFGISLDSVEKYISFKASDFSFQQEKKKNPWRAKTYTKSNFATLSKSVINVFRFGKGEDVLEYLNTPGIFIVVRGSIFLYGSEFSEYQRCFCRNDKGTLNKIRTIYPWQSFGQFSVATACFEDRYVSKAQVLKRKLDKNKQCLISSQVEGCDLMFIEDDIYTAMLKHFPQFLTHLNTRFQTTITRQIREVENAFKRKSCTIGAVMLESGIRTKEVSVVLHGRLMLRKIIPNKARTSVYPTKAKYDCPRSTLTESVFGKLTAKFRKQINDSFSDEPQNLKFVNKQPNKTINIMVLRRGDTFGRFSLFTNRINPMSVKAVRYSQLICLPSSVTRKVLFGSARGVHAFGARLGKFLDILLSKEDIESSGGMIKNRPKVFSVIPASVQANLDLFLHLIVEVFIRMGIKVQVLNSSIITQLFLAKGVKEINLTQQAGNPFLHEQSRNMLFSSFDSYISLEKLSNGEGDNTILSSKMTFDEKNRIYSIINELEDLNDIVFLVVDERMSEHNRLTTTWWSQTCVKQSDVVLHVANGNDQPNTLPIEEKLSNKVLGCNKRHELILLHFPEKTQTISTETDPMSSLRLDQFKEPESTAVWIQARDSISQHHHLRVHINSGLGELSNTSYMNHYNLSHFKSDFRRLARWLIGKSVSLVLGGGGARGISHQVILRVLEENGVPVDFIAGTSIGAFMGGMYAWKTEVVYMYKYIVDFCNEMGSLWRKVVDLTFPVVSYMTGYSFNKGLIKIFEDRKIEDLWLPFFCMSTDLTESCEIAHRNGSLWRYVRASMTLVNFIPPLCDVETEGMNPSKKKVHYLADGGYVNNLPVDVMRSFTGDDNIVIAVDVQSDWSIEGDDYGDTFHGWLHILKMLNPFVKTPKVPTNVEIQTQLAFIASVRQGGVGEYKGDLDSSTQEILSTSHGGKIISSSTISPPKGYSDIFYTRSVEDSSQKRLREMIDLFLHPPIEKFGTLQFDARKEIEVRTETYARPAIEQWLNTFKGNSKKELKQLFGIRFVKS